MEEGQCCFFKLFSIRAELHCGQPGLTLNKEPQGEQKLDQGHHYCAAAVSLSLKGLERGSTRSS